MASPTEEGESDTRPAAELKNKTGKTLRILTSRSAREAGKSDQIVGGQEVHRELAEDRSHEAEEEKSKTSPS